MSALKNFRKAVMGMGVVLVGFGAASMGGASDKNDASMDWGQFFRGMGIGITGGAMIAGVRHKVDSDYDISFEEIQAKQNAANKMESPWSKNVMKSDKPGGV